jgi:hypothetical protein
MKQPEDEMEFPQGWRPAATEAASPIPAAAATPFATPRRQRRWLPLLLFLLLLSLTMSGGFFAWQNWFAENNATISRFAVNFSSNNGRLDKDWFLEYTNLNNPRAGNVGIQDIRAKLATVGQIRRVINCSPHLFDDGATIELEERIPVFRCIYQPDEKTKGEVRLVDAEGFVYKGVKYSAEHLNSLPWLLNTKPIEPPPPSQPPKAAPKNKIPNLANLATA